MQKLNPNFSPSPEVHVCHDGRRHHGPVGPHLPPGCQCKGEGEEWPVSMAEAEGRVEQAQGLDVNKGGWGEKGIVIDILVSTEINNNN